MRIKAVDNYSSTIKYVPDQYKTQKLCIRVVNTCSFVFDYVPDQYKAHEMYIRTVDDNPSTIKIRLKKLW